MRGIKRLYQVEIRRDEVYDEFALSPETVASIIRDGFKVARVVDTPEVKVHKLESQDSRLMREQMRDVYNPWLQHGDKCRCESCMWGA